MTTDRLELLRADFEVACAELPPHERPNLDWRDWGQYRVLYTRAMFAGWCLAHAYFCEGEASGPGGGRLITVPIRTGLGLNSREHWRAKAKRVAAERWAVCAKLCGGRKPDEPCVVTLTRCGPSNGLDDDNLAGSLKAVRDEVAAWLGVDDRRREIVRYEYRQRRAKAWAVEIEFATMAGQVPALLAGETT